MVSAAVGAAAREEEWQNGSLDLELSEEGCREGNQCKCSHPGEQRSSWRHAMEFTLPVLPLNSTNCQLTERDARKSTRWHSREAASSDRLPEPLLSTIPVRIAPRTSALRTPVRPCGWH